MGLDEYRNKRNFHVTSEPRGREEPAQSQLRYVIQKHAASHLHYDFRLELDGVLKSWAVPKGPSLDPAQKRLAMHVEDHPVAYGDFEGIIPQGEYGGGTVMLWDRGTWEPVGDPRQAYREGRLKFVLHGERLKGQWMLVRRGGKKTEGDDRHWFLFKDNDEFADPNFDVTREMTDSVTTGRNLEQIAANADRVWGKKGEVKKAPAEKENPKNRKRRTADATAKTIRRTIGSKTKPTQRVLQDGAEASREQKTNGRNAKTIGGNDVARLLKRLAPPKATVPSRAHVELATLVEYAPEGDKWIHEVKFDGYRMLCHIQGGEVQLITRNGNDWTKKLAAIQAAARGLAVDDAVLDGEVVVLQSDGTTNFQALQNVFRTQTGSVHYFVFDLLHLNGRDTTKLPLENRKKLLRLLLPQSTNGLIRYSDHVVGNGPAFFENAAKLHLEGIISKRLGQPYLSGRGTDWLKVKCSHREEFVIGGFTAPQRSRQGFGSLLLGYHNSRGQLVYAGHVGTGFDQQTLATLHDRLKKLVRKESPFINLQGATGDARNASFTNPSLVAQVQFAQWTKDGRLRHPSFQGLREDKAAAEVVRDEPQVHPRDDGDSQSTSRASKRTAHSGGDKYRRLVPRGTTKQKSGEVAGVAISHPDKIIFPDDEISKVDLAHYYDQVAEWMLPHVENRLLSLVRCPQGQGNKCFFQKHPGEGTSTHVHRVAVTEKKKKEDYLTIDDVSGLISLVQMGVLEIHIWGSRADQYEKPDRLIFDLDPAPEVKWTQVVEAVRKVKAVLDEFELQSFVKTTGGKGLHVVVPIARRSSWDEAKDFCHSMADFMVASAPDRYVATMSKAAREGKIFIDYLRNDRGATAIAPFSTRARPGAPVSVPLRWEELSSSIPSNHFTINNVLRRLGKLKQDPWQGIFDAKQALTTSMKKHLVFVMNS